MEDFKTERRYLKLCHEFRAFIRYMKAAFYRPDLHKFFICPSIERVGRSFEALRQAFETLGRGFKTLG